MVLHIKIRTENRPQENLFVKGIPLACLRTDTQSARLLAGLPDRVNGGD
jgi:hypothetical protein